MRDLVGGEVWGGGQDIQKVKMVYKMARWGGVG